MKNEEDYNRAVLTREILELETALSNSYNEIGMASQNDLLDYYAYQIKAYEAKHKFLTNKLKNVL